MIIIVSNTFIKNIIIKTNYILTVVINMFLWYYHFIYIPFLSKSYDFLCILMINISLGCGNDKIDYSKLKKNVALWSLKISNEFKEFFVTEN